ncbi:MAG: 50S ribosomal protein L11 methyltransferase [bacterium]|nr:50S ribosomal protein L11 methyltransferase [bacterium]MDT8396106.1 50S ribosomal protein L11 methyltransferase [bacterium]
MSNASRQPLRIGQRLMICSSDRCDPVEERIPLYLGTARAFGSGLHETTVSCLEELETLAPLQGLTVLDVGCGTGILSIAALLLGARYATAFDVEPDASSACAGNARLNGVHDRLSVYCGTMAALKGEALGESAHFDLILANIYGDIILDLARDLAGRLAEDGRLILSGIAFEHMTDIRTSFRKLGLTLVTNRMMEDYVTMVWRKTGSGV